LLQLPDVNYFLSEQRRIYTLLICSTMAHEVCSYVITVRGTLAGMFQVVVAFFARHAYYTG